MIGIGGFLQAVFDFLLRTGAVIGRNATDAIAFVILFGLTIFVHELGHFLVALRTGMVVETFSIGFGPALWKRKIRGDIVIKLGCIPFGGYVALPQLDPAGMDAIQGGPEESKPGADVDRRRENLPPAAPWKRIAVSCAGAAGNIILAVILAWIVFLGDKQDGLENSGAVVGYVGTNSLAWAQGMRAGDRIVAVNGNAVDSWDDYTAECVFGFKKGGHVALQVESTGGTKDIALVAEKTERGIPVIEGIDQARSCVIVEVTPGSSADEAGLMTNDIVKTFAGVRVVGVEHLQDLVAACQDQPTQITVIRNNKPVDLTALPRFDAELGRARLGVMLGRIEVLPWMRYRKPGDQIKHDATAIMRFLKALTSRKEAKNAAGGVGGPILVFWALWASIKISFMNGLGFLRFLNVNLAILNMLPIPLLDGGHVLLALWESVTRRKPNPKFVNIVFHVFAGLLIALFGLLIFKDITRLRDLHRPAATEETAVSAEAPQGGTE